MRERSREVVDFLENKTLNIFKMSKCQVQNLDSCSWKDFLKVFFCKLRVSQFLRPNFRMAWSCLKYNTRSFKVHMDRARSKMHELVISHVLQLKSYFASFHNCDNGCFQTENDIEVVSTQDPEFKTFENLYGLRFARYVILIKEKFK